ncbi:hypothetical protein GCM10027614_10690 [Micromonospora vulcania]
MTNPQQPELRRNAQGATSQNSKRPGPGPHPPIAAPRAATTAGRCPGQVSPYGPAGEPVADDDTDGRA